MTSFRALLLGFLLALTLAFLNISPVVGTLKVRYTPYFPGINSMQKHEIFAPEFNEKKKIVILGPSYAYSIGCDASWSKPDLTRIPTQNAHHTCSIAHQLEGLLKLNPELSNWEVFNFASNGAKLVQMIYIVGGLLDLKPDIIIYAGGGGAYDNMGGISEALTPAHIHTLENTLLSLQEPIPSLWRKLKQEISKKGFVFRLSDEIKSNYPVRVTEDNKTSIIDPFRILLTDLKFKQSNFAWYFLGAQEKDDLTYKKTEVKYYPWTLGSLDKREEVRFKESFDFSLNPGFELLAAISVSLGSKLVVYQTPDWKFRYQKGWDDHFSKPFEDFLKSIKVSHIDLTDLPLKEITQTYDGLHQTLEGNQIIATELLRFLIDTKALR